MIRRTLTRPIIQVLLIPSLAVVLTSLTSLVLVYGFPNAGQYGFPLVWMTRLDPGCGIDPCFGGYTNYRWEFFALDAALYTGLGYAMILFVKKRWSLFAAMIVPVLAGWLTSATIYIFSVTTQTIWSNGFPIPYATVSPNFGWRDLNWVLFAIDTMLIAALEFLVFVLYKGFTAIWG